MSEMDIKNDLTGDMMVFSMRPSEVALSEASSHKRKLKTGTTTSPIMKQRKAKAVQMIEGTEMRPLLSPLPTSSVMQTITPTPVTYSVELDSADDASTSSYISTHNTRDSDFKWQIVATTEELEKLDKRGREMIEKLTHSIQAVTNIYETKLEM